MSNLSVLMTALFTVIFGSSLFGQVVIQRCDVNTGWQGSSTISVDSGDKKEGNASIKTEAQKGTSDWFTKSFSDTKTGITTSGYLTFWLYVSDASKLDGGQVEISSSGGSDVEEYNWPLTNLSNGWNEVKLQISAAAETGGAANLNKINYFRIHQTLTDAITVKIDFIRFTPTLDNPVWPALVVPEVDNSTLHGKLMFGYQGWFRHPDDESGKGWVHWGQMYEPFKLHVDMYPDMREYGLDEKYSTHYTLPDGSMAPVFSSANEKTVMRHMKWLRDYNLDGIFYQRWRKGDVVSPELVVPSIMKGCEKYGRVFAIMWDGVGGREDDIITDWKHLVDDVGVTSSDRYLHHNGLPLISLWGYSVRDEATVAGLEKLIEFFTNSPEPKYRAAVKLGVSGGWLSKNEWHDSFKKVDIISPWFSGSPDHTLGQKWCDENNLGYLPVVNPGFSWYNLVKNYEPQNGGKELNNSPREGGNYLWNKLIKAFKGNNKSVYIAMFDEVDEGTAMFKLAEDESMIPREDKWVPLNIDGYDLPSDWYLRVASLANNVVKGYSNNLGAFDDMAKPEGIMAIRITDETNGNDNGAMEFIFPDFPNETTIEISIDGGSTFLYSTADDAGTYTISDLDKGNYQVVVRHADGSPEVDMGDVFIGNVVVLPAAKASVPYPEDGATGIKTNTLIGWKKGDHAVSNYIYFGTTNNPEFIEYKASNSFNPGELEPNTTYYWRIDEENSMGTTEGDLWSFTTGDGSTTVEFGVLDYCDEFEGWSSNNSISVDSEDKQEGFASLSCEGAGTNMFQKTFDPPINTFADEDSYFDLWVYVSDVSLFDGGGQIEISSSGKPDSDEYNWGVSGLNLQNGWNQLHLPIKSAGKMGTPDLNAINFFRFYQFVSGDIVVKIDHLHFSNLATIPLSAPTDLVAESGNASVTLDWTDNSETTLAGYNVYRSLASGGAPTKVNTELLISSEYVDNDVINGTTYYYTVVGVDNLGYEGASSAEVEVMPANTAVPDAPTNLTVTAGNGEITLDWDDNTEEDLLGYNIYRSTESGTGYWKANTGIVTVSQYNISYLTNGQTYYFIVKAVNESKNESEASIEVNATPTETSVDQLKQVSDLTIFPNPASTECTVQFSMQKSSTVSVSIFDLSGKELHHFIDNQTWRPGEHTVILPLNGFNKGAYIINIEVNNEVITDKLIIK